MVLARAGVFLGDILTLNPSGPVRDTQACRYCLAVTFYLSPKGRQAGGTQLASF